MSKSKYRRSRTRTILDILTKASNSATKTRLMYRCNLNSIRLNRYLRELLMLVQLTIWIRTTQA
ncbi:hypothetical protein KAU55_05410 [Candidatus Bathyarchaeota archaeon]|nr:hypothetical protein [Candidatus Bathyarchaeota archaeon]